MVGSNRLPRRRSPSGFDSGRWGLRDRGNRGGPKKPVDRVLEAAREDNRRDTPRSCRMGPRPAGSEGA